MKGPGIWVLWLLLGTAFVLLVVSPTGPSTSDAFTDSSNSIGAMATGRKLKQIRGNPSIGDNFDDRRVVHLEDYGKIDPVPSSSAVKHGPIQHGTPLNPYISKPPPPPPPSAGHDKISGSD